jgi:hypothetical protein
MALNIEQLVVQAAQQYGVDPQLAWALAKVESNFNPNAQSSVGAIGVMQMTPVAAATAGYSWQDMFDPVKNIHAGIRYLKRMLDQFGNIEIAIAAYNAGPTYMANIINQYGHNVANWINSVYDETRNHVLRVQAAYNSQGYGSLVSSFTQSPVFPGMQGISNLLQSIWDNIFGTAAEEPTQYLGPGTPGVTVVQQYPTEDIVTVAIIGIGGILLLSYLLKE